MFLLVSYAVWLDAFFSTFPTANYNIVVGLSIFSIHFFHHYQIMQLENQLTETELDRDQHLKEAREAQGRHDQLDRDRQELADEYVNNKSNLINLRQRLEEEVRGVFVYFVKAKSRLVRILPTSM